MYGFRLTSSVAIAVALLLSVACHRESEIDVARRRRLAEIRAHDLAWFRALPMCNLPALGDTAGWRATYPGAVRIPAAFRIDSAASDGFMHGGQVWRDRDRTYTQVSGYWGFSSFQHDTVSHQCRVPLDTNTILFSVRDSADRYRASAWLVDSLTTWFTTLHLASGPRAERLFLLRVLQTDPPARR